MEKLPYPAGKPSSTVHSLCLHSRFCSILAGVFCFWWVASLLHFKSSTTLILNSSYVSAAVDQSQAHINEIKSHEHPHIHHAINIHEVGRQPLVAHRQGHEHSSLRLPLLSPSPPSTSNALSATSASIKPSIYLPLMSDTEESPLSSSSSPASSPSSSSPSSSSSSLPSSFLASSSSSALGSSETSLLAPTSSYLSSSPLLSQTLHPQLVHASAPAKGPITSNPSHDSCKGKYVYMHSLPAMFNQDMTSNCTHYSPIWVDICKTSSNGGLGPILEDKEGVLTQPVNGTYSWYNTEQFILDVIFHSRMKKYKCLTSDSSKADLIYVPFYVGLDLTRYLWRANVSVRDYLPNALAEWLLKQPEWKAMEGRDHFMVTGRISWDFRRPSDEESAWGNKLLELPALKDVSVLVIEKGPTTASKVEHAIPYPTYFHPHQDSEIYEWQHNMRAKKRVNLFAFAGASRPEFAQSIRGELIEQCRNSTFCKLLECTRGKSGCNSPTTVMKLFQKSVFCLQPSGDSYTRRSVFDSMVSGCIPVLFHPYTVYTQYNWHLPPNYTTYSVFIPEKEIKARTVVIEQVLRRIPTRQVEEMREKVISLIPSLIYAHPDHKLEKVKDAFDVAMEALLAKVGASRKHIRERAAWLNRFTRQAVR